MNYKTKGFILAASILAAAAAVYLLYMTVKGMTAPEEVIEVVFARRDITEGERISRDVIYTRNMPVSACKKDAVITGDELPGLYSCYAAAPIYRDEMLTKRRVAADAGQNLSPDERFIYFPVSGIKQMYGQLKQGDPVDILVKYIVDKDGGNGTRERYIITETLFEQVKVGKVYSGDAKPIRDKTAGSSGSPGEAASVVELYMKMDDLMEFIQKSELGEVILVGVPPNAPKLGRRKSVISYAELTENLAGSEPQSEP